MSERLNCPYCTSPLSKGKIIDRGIPLAWTPDYVENVFYDKHKLKEQEVKLGPSDSIKGDNVQALRCSKCEIVIIDENSSIQ